MAAVDDEIQPCFRHFTKLQNLQIGIKPYRVGIDHRYVITLRPAFGLFTQNRTIKTGTEVYCISAGSDFRIWNGDIATMVYCHFAHKITSPFL